MTAARFVIFVGDGDWRLARVEAGEVSIVALDVAVAAPIDEKCAATLTAMEDKGDAQLPVVLALPSSWCLSATISLDNIDRAGRHHAMCYRLEEHLPMAAEEFVADFCVGTNDSAMGVCAELNKLKPFVMGLRKVGIAIKHICSTALLAAAHALRECRDVTCVLTVDSQVSASDSSSAPHQEYDLIEIDKGQLSRWWWLSDDEAAIVDHIRVTGDSDLNARIMLVVGECESMRGVQTDGCKSVSSAAQSALEAAAAEAADLLNDTSAPWIDLARDELAEPTLQRAGMRAATTVAAAVILLLASITFAAIWRGKQYDTIATDLATKQVAVYEEAFPGQRAPGSIKARLISERRKLAGLGGREVDGASSSSVQTPSALLHMHALLKSLPADQRFRLLDLSIQPDLLRVDGQARNHVEAEHLAVLLRQTNSYDVEAPRTQILREGGVSFLFTAKPRVAAEQKQGGGS